MELGRVTQKPKLESGRRWPVGFLVCRETDKSTHTDRAGTKATPHVHGDDAVPLPAGWHEERVQTPRRSFSREIPH